jgi:type II secretory pathway component GspD/PulD (secretin)
MKTLLIFTIILLIFSGVLFSQVPGQEMRIFKLKHGNVESFYSIANTLKSSEGTVTFDTNTDSLIVVDYPANLANIAQVIESLDVPAKQVMIKVVVADVSDGFLQDVGIHRSQVIIPSGDFRAVLNLLSSRTDSNIRSQMSVRTLSGQPAQIAVTADEIIGYEVTSYRRHDVIEPVREPIGDILEVLPTVNNDGTITVVVRPSVSTLERNSTPYERSALTQVIVDDGDTIVIGGVDSVKEETTTGSIPILGIPISQRKSSKSQKVMMFLTATTTD